MDTQFIVFYLSDEKWAVPIDFVSGIVTLQGKNITEVPTLPESFKGVFNYRGNILFIISLKQMLKLPNISIFDENEAKLIVLKIENKNIGIYCDKIVDIVDIDEEDWSIVEEKKTEFINSYIDNEDLIGIIDIKDVIDILLDKV